MNVAALTDPIPDNPSVRYRADYLVTLTGAPEVIPNAVIDVTAGRVGRSGLAESAPPHVGEVETLEGVAIGVRQHPRPSPISPIPALPKSSRRSG